MWCGGKQAEERGREMRLGKASQELVFEHRLNWNKVLIHTALLGKVLQAKEIKEQMSTDGLVSDTWRRTEAPIVGDERMQCVCGWGGGGVFSFQSAVHDNLGMLPNQIWVCSPVNSKANLVKGSTAFASRTKQREQAVHAQKIPTPPHWWLSGKGF